MPYFLLGIDQVNVQRVLAAPDLKNARWGAMFATFLKLLPIFIFCPSRRYCFCTLPGELQGDQTKQTFVFVARQVTSCRTEGLLLASLLAALITSLIGVLNSVSTLFVRDFIVEFKPGFPEKNRF